MSTLRTGDSFRPLHTEYPLQLGYTTLFGNHQTRLYSLINQKWLVSFLDPKTCVQRIHLLITFEFFHGT